MFHAERVLAGFIESEGVFRTVGDRVMNENEYLMDVARRCAHLASQCFHLEIASKLRELADELGNKAAQKSVGRCDQDHGNEPEKH